MRPADRADIDGIRSLVASSGLPTEGLADDLADAFVIRDAGRVVGCAVVERYGDFGLLRSVAVEEAGRCKGDGRALVAAALDRAQQTGLREVLLLTETAPSFFSRLGFLPVARSAVPIDVQTSLEFSSVCPVSALAMARRVTDQPTANGMAVRAAHDTDAVALARIYNEGIDDRLATFETSLRTPDDIRPWFDGRHPTTVVVDPSVQGDGEVLAFASTSAYRSRECYAGVAEFSVYVDRRHRRAGLGRIAMEHLITESARAGFWKLLSRVFVENTASRRLSEVLGFREVGVYEDHAQLDGAWRDVVIVERLLHDRSA